LSPRALPGGINEIRSRMFLDISQIVCDYFESDTVKTRSIKEMGF